VYYNLTAIILKRQDFRDDDLLVTVYSREVGKLTLVARGGKKILSKLAGHLEPASLSLLNVASGKSIDQLTGARMIKGYRCIKANLDKSEASAWLLKLVNDLTLENHQDEQIFGLVEKYLDFLEKKDEDYEIVKLSVGFKLLALLGFNPVAKGELKFNQEIDFLIRNSMKKILENKKLNIKKLNIILNSELNTLT